VEPAPHRDQSGALPPRTRRDAGAGRDRGDGVPRQQRLAPRRLPRRRGVLRDQRVPDHPAPDRRTRAQRHRQPAALLSAPRPPAAARAVRPAHRALALHRPVQTGRARPAPRRRDRGTDVRVELVPDLGRAGVHLDGRLRPASPPLEPRRRGAVLPALAVDHDRADPARPAATAGDGQVVVRRRHRRDRSDGRADAAGPDR
jgi:hypothetical protein